MRILSTILLLTLLGVGKINAQLLALTLKPEPHEYHTYEKGIQIIPDPFYFSDSVSYGTPPLNKIPINAKIFIQDDRNTSDFIPRLNSKNPIFLKSKNDLVPLVIEAIDSISRNLNYVILRPTRLLLPDKKYVLFCPNIWEYQKSEEFSNDGLYAWITSQQSDFTKPIINKISITGDYSNDSLRIPNYSVENGGIEIESNKDDSDLFAKVSVKTSGFKKYQVFYMKIDLGQLNISNLLRNILKVESGDTCEVKIQLVDNCGNKSIEKGTKFIFIDDMKDQLLQNERGTACCGGVLGRECGGGHGPDFWPFDIIIYLIFLIIIIIILYRRNRKNRKTNNLEEKDV